MCDELQLVTKLNFMLLLHAAATRQIAAQTHPFSLTQLASEMQISEKTLMRKIKQHTNQTFTQYFLEWRLQKAHQIVGEEKYTTTLELTYSVGYTNPAHFAAIFKKRFGSTPKALSLKVKIAMNNTKITKK